MTHNFWVLLWATRKSWKFLLSSLWHLCVCHALKIMKEHYSRAETGVFVGCRWFHFRGQLSPTSNPLEKRYTWRGEKVFFQNFSRIYFTGQFFKKFKTIGTKYQSHAQKIEAWRSRFNASNSQNYPFIFFLQFYTNSNIS